MSDLISFYLIPGNEASVYVYLCNFTNSELLITQVRQLPYCGGNTNTTGGLRLTLNDVLNEASCDRPDVPNLIILITDGIPTREVDELPGVVQRIKDAGIRIVGVGVTNAVSSGFLNLRDIGNNGNDIPKSTKVIRVSAALREMPRFCDMGVANYQCF